MLTGDQPQSLPLFVDGTAPATQPLSPLAVLILGPPGSGKGTQAALLSSAWCIPHVSTGDLLRQRALLADHFGTSIAQRIDFGQFVPDEWINRLLDERLGQPDCRHGVILDGYPRTLPQAERLWDASSRSGRRILAIRLQVSAASLAERFGGRRQCAQCGALFHLRFQPSLAGDRCDRPGCDGPLELRQDDRPEFLGRRLADFEALTAPVIRFLETCGGHYATVDANDGSPGEIHQRLIAAVGSMIDGRHPETDAKHG